MFFDPVDFLARDPAAARDPVEAGRLWREAMQRARLCEAMARAADAKGYGGCAVADVIELAGLSRATFYKHYRNKEECFLATFEAAVETMLAVVEEALAGEAAATRRGEAAIEAMLDLLADEPAVARLVTIEARAAGERGQKRYEAALERFVALAAGVERPAGRDTMSRLIAGAAVDALVRELTARRSGQAGLGS
ncbi:MAG TPA: TetR/AcrR family transcriptional regulator [Solirubrobacterales bacterium]|nr:TetR/AcrR family transcriptional regulator [Solirubrobacterales bacterium]